MSLETILAELSDDDETWVLQDHFSGKYVAIPDDRFPGRRPIPFFLSRKDAESMLRGLMEMNQPLRPARITALKVKTKQAIGFRPERLNIIPLLLQFPEAYYRK